MPNVNVDYNLPVLFAEDGAVPVPGTFFVPNSSWTLSKIAKLAYNDASAWKVLNRNPWNIDNLVYRADSTKCTSERRDSALAVNTASPVSSKTSAYISLCQKDAKQVLLLPARTLKFPMIWIPDLDKMPMPVRPGIVEPETNPEVIDADRDRADIDIPMGPNGPVSPSGPSGPSIPSKPADVGKREKLAGIGLILGGLAALGALFFMPTKKGNR